MPRYPRESGFTLIELMLAVAILAVVATIAIPWYQGYVNEARYGTAGKDIRQIQLVLDDLAIDNRLGQLDGDSNSELGVYLDSASQIRVASSAPSGGQPWLDPWGRIYRYQRPDTTSQTYLLFSNGPDAGDSGDNVNKE